MTTLKQLTAENGRPGNCIYDNATEYCKLGSLVLGPRQSHNLTAMLPLRLYDGSTD